MVYNFSSGQYEDLELENVTPYQELGLKDNFNVYEQINTLDKQYENMFI